jgi:hypothetical protein
MLRFLIGLTLLLLAAAMPLRALAGAEPVVEDGGNLPDLRPLLEELLRGRPLPFEQQQLHPRQPAAEETERRRQEEESGRRLLQNVMERDRVYEKIQSLAELGPTFVFEAVDGSHPLQRVRAACLVGETGKIYMYDFKKDGAQAPGVVDGREFSKAIDLAKSLEHVEWRPVLARTLENGADIRELKWYVVDGRSIPLQVAGDYVGADPNPQAAEVVKLIDGWCPYAPETRSRLEMPAFEGHPRPPY